MTQVGVKGALGDTEAIGNLLAAQFAFTIECFGRAGSLLSSAGESLRAAALAAARTCRRQAGVSAFADDVAFELGERGKNVKGQPAVRSGCIDRIAETLQTYLPLEQFVDDLDRVLSAGVRDSG